VDQKVAYQLITLLRTCALPFSFPNDVPKSRLGNIALSYRGLFEECIKLEKQFVGRFK